MIWTAEDLLRQIELGEDSRLEFKEAFFRKGRVDAPSREVVADELAAFGNSTGGTLVFNVSDAGEIRRLTRSEMDALEAFVGEICSDSMRCPLRTPVAGLSTPHSSTGS